MEMLENLAVIRYCTLSTAEPDHILQRRLYLLDLQSVQYLLDAAVLFLRLLV